jgi:dGTPase
MKTDYENTEIFSMDIDDCVDVITREQVIKCSESTPYRSQEILAESSIDVHQRFAICAADIGDRNLPEEEDDYLSRFEVDKDRILLSAAFRRLARKTQVFAFPGDHQRNRLTHAIEVSQIASRIAKAIGLNVHLTEAIALGHDIGHGPGGHAAEDAFSQFIPNYFYHGSFGADVVLAPMNLCRQTLDGIRNHSWSRPIPATGEALVVSFADRIAYCTHDLEDAMQIGLVQKKLFPRFVMSVIGETKETQVNALSREIIFCFKNYSLIGMRRQYWDALCEFRKFNFEFIYNSPEVEKTNRLFVALDTALVEFFLTHTAMLPQESAVNDVAAVSSTEQDVLKQSINFVATMTDDYALRLGRELLDFEIPEPRYLQACH